MESKDLLEHGIRSVFLGAVAVGNNDWTKIYTHSVYPLGLRFDTDAPDAPASLPRKVTWFDRVKGWWYHWRFWWHTRPGGKHEEYLDY